ncbi:Thionin-like protein 2 [Vitis vinifera]|uniref:Thionin-like protein 2 n=1 Tax=Vitis vinifera TaxID=29760 RepID=A0A438HUD1_VITVI|nr:Thionin-like protein 2 [Vitis vinifera]
MERGSIRALVMVGLVMGMLVGQSTASFKDCYTKCFIFCIITPNNTAFSCSLECLKDCVIPSHPLDIETADTTYFCKLGCASTLCTNLSTKKNPAGEKVESCVNSCSNKCTEYHPSPSKTQQFNPAKP